ncbi:hypothetical protein [Bythopirellula goksoeyrii]|uniref:hypothetical protein n=1 Tax=Bythopirellula goksoeyrii TaxID=1400387 RepID=UPI00143D589F|nr:hypothetical protein [Bythopirellula goksoeyrii]
MEEQLRASLGTAPTPDFDSWCKRHPDATAVLKSLAPPAHTHELSKYIDRRTVMIISKVLAASLLIVCGLMWIGPDSNTLSQSAFANSIPGIDNVQTMKWTSTIYIRLSDKDGKKSLIRKERRLYAYRHPGQYRETFLDEEGKPYSVEITDLNAGRMLTLDLREKKAVLKFPPFRRDLRSPFAWVGDMIRERKYPGDGEGCRVKSVSLQGQKEIDRIQANVVRVITLNGLDQNDHRTDFFFDASTKQLVGMWGPNEVDLEFETLENGASVSKNEWYRMEPIGGLTHEIVLDTKIAASEFSLDPPADYAFEKMAKPTVTEGEMIAYLGAAARFNNQVFPESPYNAFDSDKFNAASYKDPKDRTKVEQAMIDIRDKIMMREIYRSPVKQFEEDQTVPNSFYYVGTGVEIGQADKIVGWYRLRQGKQLRAFYGDLSVKDITESQLPLNLLEQ